MQDNAILCFSCIGSKWKIGKTRQDVEEKLVEDCCVDDEISYGTIILSEMGAQQQAIIRMTEYSIK